jgi:8-oxo-dGTP pyrophosphatase MutT (NUDIX family)
MDRPGFGEPHPRLVALLESLRPLAVQRTAWAKGTMPVEVSGYAEIVDLPDELVTSVRCLVRVGERWILCTNADGAHAWPGGRREAGESHAETAIREVHEETGWRLEGASLRPLGWLHLRHLGPRTNAAYPYHDFLQVVLAGSAKERDGAADAAWTDTDGWESASLVGLDEALARIAGSPVASLFLQIAARAPRGSQR